MTTVRFLSYGHLWLETLSKGTELYVHIRDPDSKIKPKEYTPIPLARVKELKKKDLIKDDFLQRRHYNYWYPTPELTENGKLLLEKYDKRPIEKVSFTVWKRASRLWNYKNEYFSDFLQNQIIARGDFKTQMRIFSDKIVSSFSKEIFSEPVFLPFSTLAFLHLLGRQCLIRALLSKNPEYRKYAQQELDRRVEDLYRWDDERFYKTDNY